MVEENGWLFYYLDEFSSVCRDVFSLHHLTLSSLSFSCYVVVYFVLLSSLFVPTHYFDMVMWSQICLLSSSFSDHLNKNRFSNLWCRWFRVSKFIDFSKEEPIMIDNHGICLCYCAWVIFTTMCISERFVCDILFFAP